MTDYLSTADILGIHHVLLEQYGGSGGLRDLGALESAVFRPQCGYYDGIIEEAAALLESLLINHPFIDGNKRVAFAACDVFLRINGCRLVSSPAFMFENMIKWIQNPTDRLDAIKHSLQENIVQYYIDKS
ncbi:type II toxin-antitoxin system death-on-curing family toxin [Deltaproteobacteria bacterium Smac51]|nr:type II toxin-antitoxin system death-on-curing family toxin [Deltaproteobacteria bacterium Smac51]